MKLMPQNLSREVLALMTEDEIAELAKKQQELKGVAPEKIAEE